MGTSTRGSDAPTDAISYRFARSGDQPELLELFNLVFGKSFSSTRWLWAYDRNPLAKPFFSVALCGGECAGLAAVSPQRYVHANRTLAGGRVQNVMMHPDHRRKGIFLQTMGRLTELLKKDVDFVVGFPNEQSLPAVVKVGYRNPFDIDIWELPLQALGSGESPTDSLVLEECPGEPVFSEEDAALASACLEGLEIWTTRESRYLSWRYHRDSGNEYTLFRAREHGTLIGWAVTKPYVEGSSVDLLEFLIKPRERVAWFLGEIGRRYRALGLSTFQMWLDRHYPHAEELTRLGFAPTGKSVHLAYLALSNRVSPHCDRRDSYYLSMGDSDVY